jgi:hypothetical protein
MSKLYKLTAQQYKEGYVIEERFFTSKRIAYEQRELLIEYLVWNYDLDKREIKEVSNIKEINSIIIENSYMVTVVEHEILTKPSKYI